MIKKIAVITMARNDAFFLGRWIEYYGRELGKENLYVFLDGLDQAVPLNAGKTNIIKLEHHDLSRLDFDKHKSSTISKIAHDLFSKGYDIVIGTDSDEFLIVDPKTKKSLVQYLSEQKIKTPLSGLGMDVGQDLNQEDQLDPEKPFLTQRGFALLSTRYTKPVVISKPARWGRGFHCVKGHNFKIDKNLYLLHFGSVDYEMVRAKIGGNRDSNWNKHVMRRSAGAIFTITKKKNRSEKNINLARTLQTFLRPIYAWNKPAMFGLKLVTKIPERFKGTKI
ncbi:MAG TPA: glycosyltransferase family 2 protein [Alphaproteobacteria bacterium]|nr:glycosyltransferase family 2 protein [Alphaproteobacteria bacterium]